MMQSGDGLRVAFVAGGLAQGGAEKQFVYMVRAVKDRGADVRCFCLTQDDFYERVLADQSIPVTWIGRFGAPPLRLFALSRALAAFKPHVVHSGHFFANLYAVVGAWVSGAVSIGAIRNDGLFELRENRRWGPWLLRWPTLLIANSNAGCRNGAALGRNGRIVLVPNVIDVGEFDGVTTPLHLKTGPGVLVVAAGRLVRAKRFDRFFEALALARSFVPGLHAVVVGDGPERTDLERRAAKLEIGSAVRFIGLRPDVPALLRQADIVALSSDHEGFPNVILEAMAARVPVVTTSAGDAGLIVENGVTGFVVSDSAAEMANRLVVLARDAGLRSRMGEAARRRAEVQYHREGLGHRLLAAYAEASECGRARRTLRPREWRPVTSPGPATDAAASKS